MSRFTPLLLFLVLAAAVYLPQSGERPETVGVDAANVAEITTEGSVKERSAEVAKPIESKPVNVVTSADAADKPVEASRTPDIPSAANAQACWLGRVASKVGATFRPEVASTHRQLCGFPF